MPENPLQEPNEVLSLLGDEYVQGILVATSEDARSAKELSELVGADVSTVYRRVDDMLEADFLVERTALAADGSHHSVYEANLDHLDVEIRDGELVVEMDLRESPAERFTRIWDGIRES
ncbi:transcriptional regulator [Halobacterium rubrum]|uniref:transcriptional regulator n=1 Tax=Halobacterium TaxID=2239 RepID=UPI001F479514|nr:transcriptional regulator [Halobacterium rubrum]MDH5019791.1 transcriptional regulator [Halobacterium rubrum]